MGTMRVLWSGLGLVALLWCHGKALFCESPQYIQLGKAGIINCTINEDYFGIYWYNSSESRKSTPLLSLEGSAFGGAVYPSDEFQILDNGSLSITRVTLQHDHIFRLVLVVNKELGLIEKRDVEIVVIVQPLQHHPHIDNCGTTRGCIVQLQVITNLKCKVSEMRPAPNLTWVVRTSKGDVEYPSNSSVSREGTHFSAVSEITTAFINSTVLLVCRSTGPPLMLKYPESFVLIETNDGHKPLLKETSINAELGSPIVLNCGKNSSSFVKWERMHPSPQFHPIAFAVFSQPLFSHVYIEKWDINQDGSLITHRITAVDEGIFSCLTDNGNEVKKMKFNVTVLAYPHPAVPVVEGCDLHHVCSFEVFKNDSIKCSLYGFRPLVQLEWVILTEIHHENIRLHNQHYTTANGDGTFDVHLKTEFHVVDKSTQTFTMACRATIFESIFSTSVRLLVIDDNIQPTTASPNGLVNFHFLWIIIPFVCVVVFGVFLMLKTARRYRTRNVVVGNQEMTPMMEEGRQRVKAEDSTVPFKKKENEESITPNGEERRNLKDIFIKQIRHKYKLQYDAIRPIPYIRDKMYNVKSIFVDSTIEALRLSGGVDPADTDSWQNLHSYHELVESSNPCRTIIQGDPGYGKTTLTLQMAYDWSTKQSCSPLCKKEVLIVLRLRQLFGIESVYRAIKLFLLPKDTTINESEVKEILQTCVSAVVILDGFDEYPHQDGENIADVVSIIAGDMFQEFQVIICTRPLSLPEKIPPGTRRARLNGFDKRAQEIYIKKAVTRDPELTEKIHTRLRENPVLGDFCQVPLFFVMFAHMTKENEEFQDVNSATSFFRHVIRCFHSHLQNKATDQNANHYKILENDHTALDELSFEVLERTEEISWRKDKLRERIGDQFYDYYVRLGILCEEEISDPLCEVFPYRVDVHFYHKLFCEWYAAHHLSLLAETMDFQQLRTVLKNLDLFELHYVFRFSCGLSSTAARKILKHLKLIRNGERFATLCILEQTGKFVDIKEHVSQICSDDIYLRHDDNKVLQRSTIQLMVIASRNEITISSVWLRNCLRSAEDSGEGLRLTTGLTLPRLDTIVSLHILMEGTRMTSTETLNIIKFATLSSKIKEVSFHLGILPQNLTDEPVLNLLKQQNIKVKWSPDAFSTLLLTEQGLWKE